MKKKISLIFVTLFCIICCVFAFTACGNDVDNGKTKHSHKYGAEWVTDEDCHWHECKNSGCYEKVKDQADHVDNNNDGKCDVCKYQAVVKRPTEGLRYILSDDKSHYICAGRGEAKDTDIVISSEYNGIPVTEIYNGELFWNEELGIYEYNYWGDITSITIPSSITNINPEAFKFCDSLTSIAVDKGNTKYHSKGKCLIETETKTLIIGCKNSIIPDDGSVTTITGYAFYGRSNMTTLTIPDKITSIGGAAFANCNSLTNITFKGTKEQWNAVEKGATIEGFAWDIYTGDYTIHCTDGDIVKNS